MANKFEMTTVKPARRETSESSSELTLRDDEHLYSHLLNAVPPSEDTRMKTRLLTYVRQNYLKIFLLLLALIVVLTALVAILLYVHLSAKVTEVEYTVHNNLTGTHYPSAISISTTRLSVENNYDSNPWLQGLPCKRLRCNSTSCEPKKLDYLTMRGYTCCNCIDPRYTFRRFRYDYLRDEVSLIFQVPEVITSISKQDLMNMPPLPNLNGVWNKQQESDTAWYYVYEGIAIPTPPPED